MSTAIEVRHKGLAEAAAGRRPDECWPWQGHIMRRTGYGQAWHEGEPWLAHRLAYTLAVGPISDGLTLDHRCHTDDPTCEGGITDPHRACVNPAHLVPVTRARNTMLGNSPHAKKARLTMCEAGLHELSGENLGINRHGDKRAPSRYCRACLRARRKEAAA